MWKLIVLAIIFLFISIYKAKIKGIIGEKIVEVILKGLDTEKYILLNDIVLKTNNGTTQIDHIVLSIYGIFVIETKNYKGIITGSDYSENWTKNMYGKKYSFYNPIKQNYAHIKALEDSLKLPENVFIPIVTFSPDSTIKVNSKNHVIYMTQLKKTVLNYNQIYFSTQKIKEISKQLSILNIDDKIIKKQHVTNIKAKVATNNEKLKNNICPKCGGNMVIRKGKYGDFKGCTNYPKCRYTARM